MGYRVSLFEEREAFVAVLRHVLPSYHATNFDRYLPHSPLHDSTTASLLVSL